MSETLTLDIEDAKELRFDEIYGYEVLEREQIDTRRWMSRHRIVFLKDGDPRYWAWTYDEPLTEIQEWPDLYDRDLVAYQVFPKTKVVTYYSDRP